MLCRSRLMVWQQRQTPLMRRKLLSRGTGFLAILAVTLQSQGCARYAEGLPPISDVNAGEYHLGPGDQVRILTFGEEQLTGEFRVNARGDIALPLVGNVHAAGLTPDQLADATKELLTQSKLYKNPSVGRNGFPFRS
jgi:polysaccharide export outer membrane protein